MRTRGVKSCSKKRRSRTPNGVLDVESENLDHYAEDLERAFETEIKTAEAAIKEARKAMRGSTLPMAEKLAERSASTPLKASETN